jgi:hypothetical protein
MAATSKPPAGGKKKFDLGNPGGKEYAIVGGVVLALALVYFYIKKKSSGSTSSAAGGACTDANGSPGTLDASGNCIGSGASAPSTATGLNTSALLAWIQDHNSSSTTTTTSGGGGTTGGSGSTGSTGTGSKTPDYWQTAIDLLKKGGNANPTHAQIEAEYKKITPAAVRKKEEAFNKAHGKK